MRVSRRRFLHLAASTATLPVAPRIAPAKVYRAGPVHLIVGFAPGGAPDILARLMAQWLAERLDQSFVVESRPGAGGSIATEAVVRAAGDGHTLLLVTSADSISVSLYEHLSYNFIRDIMPVAALARAPNVLEVHPSFPATTIPEFIAYAKANPGKINMASAGTGTTQHLASELFKVMAGVELVHVPYRGSAPALTDLLGGQ